MSEDSDLPDDVRALLPGAQLKFVETLQSGERSTVVRARATDPDGTNRSLIVKRFHGEHEGWCRERAALLSVPGAVRVPDLVASAQGLLVLEDLGDGASVADALLGDDPTSAAAAVTAWAEAVAELHCATRDSRSTFRAELGDDLAESWLPGRLREAERLLDRHCGSLGVTIPANALAEFAGLHERLGVERTAALTPADACPDNNLHIGERLVLIDFEGAQWCHIAWDVAYLLVPWPTCWCAWRLPEPVVAEAFDRYRSIAVAAFPEVGEDSFARDVETAALGWSLLSVAFSLDHVLGETTDLDQQVDLTRTSPQRRVLIMDRLRRAAATTAVPVLAELADGLHTVLRRRWDDFTLDLAPAFRPPP